MLLKTLLGHQWVPAPCPTAEMFPVPHPAQLGLHVGLADVGSEAYGPHETGEHEHKYRDLADHPVAAFLCSALLCIALHCSMLWVTVNPRRLDASSLIKVILPQPNSNGG